MTDKLFYTLDELSTEYQRQDQVLLNDLIEFRGAIGKSITAMLDDANTATGGIRENLRQQFYTAIRTIRENYVNGTGTAAAIPFGTECRDLEASLRYIVQIAEANTTLSKAVEVYRQADAKDRASTSGEFLKSFRKAYSQFQEARAGQSRLEILSQWYVEHEVHVAVCSTVNELAEAHRLQDQAPYIESTGYNESFSAKSHYEAALGHATMGRINIDNMIPRAYRQDFGI